MPQFAGHWYSGRAARLVCVEGAMVGLALAMSWRGGGGMRELAALVAAGACVPAALYLADLYDPQVMRNDRGRGSAVLKALGFAALAAAIFGLLAGGMLPRGALIDTIGLASVGVLLSRALLVARSDERGHNRVLVIGVGQRAIEVQRLIRVEAFGEYEIAGSLDPSADLADARAVPAVANAPEPVGGLSAPSPELVPAAQIIVGPQGAPSRMQGAEAEAAAKTAAEEKPLASVVSLPTAHPSIAVPARTLAAAAAELRADTVIIASDERRARLPVDELIRLRLSGVTVLPAHRFAERVLRRVPLSLLRPSDLAIGEGLSSPAQVAAKRMFDLLASGVLLLLAAPLLGVLAVLIKLDSEGPVFYSQERVGRLGKVYKVYKLRTMRRDAEKLSGPVWASQRDPRVTRLGAFLRKARLDEIPQAWAVFKGDMSFVGPRPERPFFVQQLKAQIPFFGLREAVKPGITGWAQIRYPYGATVEDARNKLEYDLYYVQHQSLFLDLMICFHTFKTVLFGRGAR